MWSVVSGVKRDYGITAATRTIKKSSNNNNFNDGFALVAQPLYGLATTGIALAESTPTVQACASYTSVLTTNMSTWDLSETKATGHNELVSGGLRLWTESNTSTDKAAGYYATDFSLANLDDKTIADSIDYNASFGLTPGLQLKVDFNNDGTVDGILVGESVYGNSWWLSNSAAQFVKDDAAHTGGGYGSDWYGTPNEWLAKFPTAKVKAIGYSLGSGVHADGTLKRITLGCVNYTFNKLPLPAPTDLTPTDNSFTSNPSFDNKWSKVEGATKYEYIAKYNLGGGEQTYTDTSDAGNYVLGGTTIVRHNNNAPETMYTWRVRAIDNEGIPGAWSGWQNVTVDKTAPAAPLLALPANNAKVKGASVTQSWANGGSTDVDHYVYESYNNAGLSSLRWREDISGMSKTANNVANATYWWRVKSVDHAGNSSPWSEVRKLTIDNTKPTADLRFPNIGSSAKSFKVKFNESVNPVDAVNPANYFLHNWPGGGWYESLVGDATVSYDEATTTATVTFTNPAWYVSAEQNWGVRNIHDIAGNQIAETSEYSTPMNGPLFGALTINENHNVLTWGWTASDPEMTNSEGASGASGVKEYEYRLLRGSDVVLDWTKTTGNSAVTTVTQDGDYVFELKTHDNAGNESGLVTISAHLDTTAPVLTMDTPVLNSDGSYTIRVTTDDPSSPISFYLDGTLIAGATSNSDKTVWTITTDPLDAEETHTISAKSSDPSGNAATPVSKQFTVPPVTTTTLGANIVPSAITQPTTNFAAVFAQPLTQQAQTEQTDTGVLGAETKKEGTDIVPVTATPQGWKIFGIAWYWILLTIVVLGSAAWWGIASARRRAAQDV